MKRLRDAEEREQRLQRSLLPKAPKTQQQTRPHFDHGWQMTTEAHVAMSKAVLNGFRSPDARIDPQLMEDALNLGVERDAIMQSLNKMLLLKNPSHGKENRQQQEQQQEQQQTQTTTTAQATPKYNVRDGKMTMKGVKALSKAVMSGFRSSTGTIDSQYFDEALREGVSPEEIDEALNTMLQKKFKPLAAAVVDSSSSSSSTQPVSSASASVVDHQSPEVVAVSSAQQQRGSPTPLDLEVIHDIVGEVIKLNNGGGDSSSTAAVVHQPRDDINHISMDSVKGIVHEIVQEFY